MARGANQKLKLCYLTKIMLEKTDDEHGLTLQQILDELARYDVSAERKSIYGDFHDMTEKLGIEVIKEQIGRETYYHVGTRQFELAEVKLLIDAIQSSKFIPEKNSRVLIGKIKGLVSEHQAKQLSRQVYINDRVKTMNGSAFYNVDTLHHALNTDKQIRFKYYKWNIRKDLVPRRSGEYFTVSPWALTWNDENYYLVAYDAWDQKIKHYRVDKMKDISVLEKKREGRELFENFDMVAYTKMNFGMYNGEKRRVHVQLPNTACGVFIDRFGTDISFRPVDENHSTVSVDVAVSSQFFGWIFSLGAEVRVVGPEAVVEQMREAAEKFIANYKE